LVHVVLLLLESNVPCVMGLTQNFFGLQIALVWPFCSSLDGRIKLDASGAFQDASGRARVFHGVNVVQKSFPWHPSLGDFDARSSLNAKDMADLKSWGFNAVRLGVMWPGVETSDGQYNATYLQIMRQLVDDLYQQGIYTIVDFHQDAFTQQYCGEGIPDWMLPMLEPIKRTCSGVFPEVAKMIGECQDFAHFNYSRDPATGFPEERDCLSRGFDMYSRTPEVVSAWGNFFAFEAVQKKVQAYWRTVATAMAGAPGVLGYDLVNEPLGGNFFADPSLLKPGHADRTILQPWYAELNKVIRAVDPDAIMMYEPTPFPDTFPSSIPWEHGVHPVGFTSGPAGDDVAHQALSYHIYSCGFAQPQCNKKGDLPSVDCKLCDDYALKAVSSRQDSARKLGGGVFLSEFGACSGSDPCLAEINRVANAADTALQSWAYWQFKYNHDITTVAGPEEGFYGLDDSLIERKVKALSRTYAPAVAGVPELMRYEPRTGAFRLRYIVVNSSLHTEVFLNERMNYPEGYQVSLLNSSVLRSTNQLQVLPAAAGISVDVALVNVSSTLPRSGIFKSAGGGSWRWNVEDSLESPGFSLTAADDITRWKAITVRSDDGKLLCNLQTQDDRHGPDFCVLSGQDQHSLLFQYRIEVWKSKTLGHHALVDAVSADFFGPLLGKKVSFEWISDSDTEEEREATFV